MRARSKTLSRFYIRVLRLITFSICLFLFYFICLSVLRLITFLICLLSVFFRLQTNFAERKRRETKILLDNILLFAIFQFNFKVFIFFEKRIWYDQQWNLINTISKFRQIFFTVKSDENVRFSFWFCILKLSNKRVQFLFNKLEQSDIKLHHEFAV